MFEMRLVGTKAALSIEREFTEVRIMADEKDKFGETMKLVERAKEDIYFAERDREVLEKLRGQLRKVERIEQGSAEPNCPKCPGKLETFTFHGITLDRCRGCHGVWMDYGELEAVVRKVSRGPIGEWIDTLTART